jgi:hypothetical protein
MIGVAGGGSGVGVGGGSGGSATARRDAAMTAGSPRSVFITTAIEMPSEAM